MGSMGDIHASERSWVCYVILLSSFQLRVVNQAARLCHDASMMAHQANLPVLVMV